MLTAPASVRLYSAARCLAPGRVYQGDLQFSGLEGSAYTCTEIESTALHVCQSSCVRDRIAAMWSVSKLWVRHQAEGAQH